MEHVRWLSRPTLRNPVMVAAFTGWNDAGDAASGGVRHLVEEWGAAALAEIDPEEFTDFATIRPHVRLSSGLTRNIVWPTVGLWHAHYNASLLMTLGALLADVPHSRPVQLIGTASDQDMIERHDLQRSRYEGPTGIVGIIHDACAKADLPSASLWAAVPAYASQVPSPKASLALVERLGTIIGTAIPTAALVDAVDDYERRVTAIVADDDDLSGYVRRLESMNDAGIEDFSLDDDDDIEEDDDDDDDDIVGGELSINLPEHVDGTALIDEVEQFLRDQGK
jgi:hypothetical protein